MIAQEVEKVFPDWVDTAPNGMKRLSIHGFEALTVEALRDLRKEKDQRIAALEADNARIQNQLSEQKANAERLEARLSALEKTLAHFAGTEQASLTAPRATSAGE
jgi:chromosome segregation ATPase